MTLDPLRSALKNPGTDDTSLALPSDNNLRSGHQRVLDQVHTVKRTKSKHGKNGALSPGTLSPTSPSSQSLTTNDFGSFKFSPTKANGTFHRNSSSSTLLTGYTKSFNAQKSRTLSSRSITGKNYRSSGTWEQQINTSNWPNGLKPSRSDPALAALFSPAPAPGTAMGKVSKTQKSLQTRGNRLSTYSITNGSQMTTSQVPVTWHPSAQSQTEGKMGTMKVSKFEQQSVLNGKMTMSDLTLKTAVAYLSHHEEDYQQCGAIFIQHATFKEEQTKQEVLQLGGILPLVSLLRSSNPAVSQAAAGALRNLVFKHQGNKLEVQRCEGIAKALQLLKETDSPETQKQVTGLLWNLSSADELKRELIVTALPALTENVVVPFTCWSDNCTNNNIHPDVFYHATGCLRNLSCGKQKERQAMRECRGLIDSLMNYVQSCVAEENPDDKSVENCVCILHNMTYQLEDEYTECFRKFQPKTDGSLGGRKSPTIGCFSPKSSKAQQEYSFDVTQRTLEEGTPSGVNWLCHTTAMQTYLSLLGSSQKDTTLEASCGALQNLTASKGLGSSAMTQILVQKLGALAQVSPLLKSPNPRLQKTVMSLLGNMSRTSSVQTSMARQLLPELTSLLSSNPREMGNGDETMATVCNTVRTLMLANPEISKKVISKELVSSLADLSENGSFHKGSKAASVLLYSLWNEKSLQGVVKKLGIGKSLFVNESTTAAHKSVQVIE